MKEIQRNEPIPIIDGYVTIYLSGLKIKQRVKQVKGRGTSDADKLTKANPFHLTILRLLLNTDKESYTGRDIREIVKINFTERNKEFIDNNWMRPISELYRKGILVQVDKEGNAIVFKLNRDKAKYVIRTSEFSNNDTNFDIGMDSVRRHKQLLLGNVY